MSQEPPAESDFDEAEAYPIMEETVVQTIADLPEFPGFYERIYRRPTDCSEVLGDQYDGYVSLEMNYGFGADNSKLPLVRETYTELLREQWEEAGYDIHRDDINAETGEGSIEAEMPNGINLWWWVSGGVSLTVQTGCIPATPDFDKPDYIPPAGGVLPENDPAAQNRMNPPEDPTTEAIDPFASASESPSGG